MNGEEEELREAVTKMGLKYSGLFDEKLDGPAVSWHEVNEMQAKDTVYLVDVRSKAEREVSMVTGAMSRSDFEALDLQPEEEKNKNIKIVTYCTIGYRSGKYACELSDKGWNGRVSNGQGVVPWSWEKKEGLLVHDGQPTMRVHTYGPAWNNAGPGYTTETFSVFRQIITFLFGG
jgi:rhodanese-related sulfurtransferase